jgi:hypothetical protein
LRDPTSAFSVEGTPQTSQRLGCREASCLTPERGRLDLLKELTSLGRAPGGSTLAGAFTWPLHAVDCAEHTHEGQRF